MRGKLDGIGWSPTIALSWLWGFAFLVAFQIAFAWGWSGLAAFAVPYALGLFVFGSAVGSDLRKPPEIYKSLQGRFLGLFLLTQSLIVAAAVFAAAKYLYVPLLGPGAIAVVALLVLFGASLGHSASFQSLRPLHLVGFAIALAAGVVICLGLLSQPAPAPLAADLDVAAGTSIAIPAFVGLMLGPWADARQWQLASAIHREAGSTRLAYGIGACLFLAMAALVALAAHLALGHGAPVQTWTTAHALLAQMATGTHAELLRGALAVWAGTGLVAAVATAYSAIGSLLKRATAESTSPLLAFLPSGLVTSPIWFVLTAAVVASFAATTTVPAFWFVVPFATLLVGPTVCLICEAMGIEPHYDGVLCGMIGAASLLIFMIGYVGALPLFMVLAPLIGLIGAAPAIQALFANKKATPAPTAHAADPAGTVAALPLQTIDVAPSATVMSHGFDGQWFVLHIVPTYDDTNSVGNVYFANYFRWVGKARELFFNACMPDFNLTTSDFLVLTKSFHHEFRREMREFQPLSVRVKIGSYNRKFVTIQHEIQSAESGLVGRGEQTIMFVDTVRYRPVDIPAVILKRFLPYYVPNAPAPAQAPPPSGAMTGGLHAA